MCFSRIFLVRVYALLLIPCVGRPAARGRSRHASSGGPDATLATLMQALLALTGLAAIGSVSTARAAAPQVVGWWVGDITNASLARLELLEWDVYTIIRPCVSAERHAHLTVTCCCCSLC